MRVADMKCRITFVERKATVRGIITEVASKHDLSSQELLSKNRKRKMAWARHEAFSRLYQEKKMSLLSIARVFDLDHTSVLFGIRAHHSRKAQGKVS
jgi:chromosomal replication initiator protein